MKKYGFTLAEVIIVIMIVGALAVSVLPNVLAGIRNARYKTVYKRSFQSIHAIMAKEYLEGQLPVYTSDDTLVNLYMALLSNLSTKEYAEQKQQDANEGVTYNINEFKNSVSYTHNGKNSIYGNSDTTVANGTGSWLNSVSPWIITEDNVAYAITGTASTECYSKESINAAKDIDEINSNSCAIVIVDTNGLTTGPNKIEEQVINGVNEKGKVNTLTGDRFYIYIGKNGVATGSKATSLSARLINNMN